MSKCPDCSNVLGLVGFDNSFDGKLINQFYCEKCIKSWDEVYTLAELIESD